MLKKYIPEKYDIDNLDIAQLIYTTLGKQFVIILKGRTLIIPDEILTAQEKNDIKTAFLANAGIIGSLDE